MKDSQAQSIANEMTENDAPTVKYLTADERETIIRLSDGDDLVRIWTARRRDITALRKKPDATETSTGFHGTTEWAEFTIPRERWSTGRGIKGARRHLSDEQKAAVAERFRKAREARS